MRVETIRMNCLASSLWAVGANEAEDAQIALAWMARNLVALRRASIEEACDRLRQLWPPAMGEPGAEPLRSFADKSYCRTFSIMCRVWAGDCKDPTSGATIAHRHDEEPAWADTALPTALIGPWIFYRPA